MTTKIEAVSVRQRAGSPTAAPTLKDQASKPGTTERFVGVFFGPPKTGKTTAACSHPNVLLLEFDPTGDSTATLKGRDDVFVLRPRSYEEVQAIIKKLQTTDRGTFDVVVVDSVTFLFQVLGGEDINNTFLSNRDVRRAYGKAGAAVQQIVYDLVYLPDAHVIFIAHLEKEFTEDGVSLDTDLGETEVKLAVTPMVWKVLGPAVGFIGRTYKTNVYVQEGKTKKLKTKFMVSFNDGNRSPVGAHYDLPASVEVTPSTLKELADQITGGT